MQITEQNKGQFLGYEDDKHAIFINEENYQEKFQEYLDNQLSKLNPYYNDLISGKILNTLKIRKLKKNAFIQYMKSIKKLGGQNKVPRLSNDRKLADKLIKYII